MPWICFRLNCESRRRITIDRNSVILGIIKLDISHFHYSDTTNINQEFQMIYIIALLMSIILLQSDNDLTTIVSMKSGLIIDYDLCSWFMLGV